MISKRRLVGAVVVCVVLVAGLALLWQGGQVAEAAVLYPHPGLVGWWRFDEGNGSVAEDSSGFGNDGTVYGATWVNGKYGKALSFDGVNDYVEVPSSSSLDVSISFTTEAWIKTEQTAAAAGSFICKMPAYTRGYWMKLHAGHLFFAMGDGTNWYQGMTTENINDGAWHHVAVVVTSDKVRYYIDSVKVKEDTHSVTGSLENDELLYLGRHDYEEEGYYEGFLDEARVYNRALSANEIKMLFQKEPDFSSRLLAKVPKGTTQFIITLSWQGVGSINVTIESPSKNYTENMVPVYQKTVYSTSGSISDMLNIKRVAVSVTALSSDENWYIVLESDNVEDYRITVEVQR